MKNWKHLKAVPLAAICLAGVVACGGSGSEGASGDDEGTKVLYLVPTFDDEAYKRQADAAKAQAEKYPDIEFEVSAGAGRTAAQDMISKIESGITQGVDVIVVDSGSAGDQLKPALEKARAEGIKVVVNSQPIEGLEVDATVGFDHEAGAVPGGEYVAQHLKSGDQVVMVRCFIGTPATDARAAGFEKGMEGSGIEIVETVDAECDPEKGRTIAENMLTAHPDLAGFVSDTDIAVIGVVEAIKADGKTLFVMGHDGQIAALEAIKAGDMTATVVYPYGEFGVVGVDTAAKLAKGEEVPATVTIEPQGVIDESNVQQYLDAAGS